MRLEGDAHFQEKIQWGGEEKIGGAKIKIGGAMPPMPPAGDAPEYSSLE